MKRILVAAILLGTLLGAGLFYTAVKAQTSPMTEEHIERIRVNCVDAQSILSQLHASDGLLRVNRGQLYESISTKLMAPFNSRVALNKYDGSKLVEQSALYERQLNEFRSNYIAYEEAMTRTLKINCVNEPVAFYDSVGETRAKRQLVHQSTITLHKTIQGYKDAFEAFAATISEKKQ
jgi:hypothetical protein